MQPQLLPLQQTGEDMDEVAIEELSVLPEGPGRYGEGVTVTLILLV